MANISSTCSWLLSFNGTALRVSFCRQPGRSPSLLAIVLFAFLNNIVISAYFVIGAYLEERKLVREFGEVYREYQKNVSMLFPYKWLKAKIAEPT